MRQENGRMLKRSTIAREIRAIEKGWQGKSGDDYHFLRGAEFALAWVLDADQHTKVSQFIARMPQMMNDLKRAMKPAVSHEESLSDAD